MNTKILDRLYANDLVQANSMRLLTIKDIVVNDLNNHYNINIASHDTIIDILRLINENITSLEHIKYLSNEALYSENGFSIYGSDWTEVRSSADSYFNI
jgi:hypothetical protein